jgi:hypothetical protein
MRKIFSLLAALVTGGITIASISGAQAADAALASN